MTTAAYTQDKAKQAQRPQPALDVHRLAVGYPNDPYALEDINFTVNTGERVAVIGPNGAGKSTLFKAIVGVLPFTMGHISIDGKDCRSSHARVGYVPQHTEIDWDFPVSVYDVVMMGRARHIGWFRRAGKQDQQRVHQLLDDLNLSDLAQRPIRALSGGQQRRVFIARALAQEASVLLMDEPFTGVDKAAEEDIMHALDLLKQSGITVLLATHDLDKVVTQFDKAMLIRGRLLAYGAPATVMQPGLLRQAFGGGIRVFQDGHEYIMITDEHGYGD